MKVEQAKIEFKPVKVSLTFESEEEIKTIFNIFNHSRILDASENTGQGAREIYNFLCGLNSQEVNSGSSFDTFESELRRLMDGR